MSRVIHGLAAIGVGITAFHVLPSLWESNVLDCLVVGSSLGVSAGLMLIRAVFGRVAA